MKNSKVRVLLLLVAFIVILVASGILYSTLSKKNAVSSSVPVNSVLSSASDADSQTEYRDAADFTVYNAAGDAVKLSDFKGTPVVINFWASWCGPCKIEMPDFDKLHAEYGEDIVFMMVNLTDGTGETQETAQTFIDEEGYTFPVYFDLDMEGAIAYSVRQIPTSYFIDKEGKVVSKFTGIFTEETLRVKLDALLQ